ncbi:endonuclease [Xanthomonadaceae bacterium JHOS43]|nr:endonuclease [Xanthomonadaceae bacterium JHOS43]
MNAFKTRRLLAALVACLPMTAMAQQVGSGVVSLTGPGAGATQDFNTLESVHGATSDVLPAGWYFLEAGGSSRNTYLVDDGGSNQGNVMSYGTNGSTDRGFGVLPGNALGAGGSVIADIGARLNNASGNTLSSLQVSFFTEAWLYQGAVGERFVFEYSSDATSLDTGNWSALPTLDAVTPAVSGNGKKDGNAPTNRMEVTGTINGLNVAAGSDLWVRWRATNQSGNDNGLAIDDIVFGTPVDVAPTLLASIPVNGATDFPADGSLMLTFSEAVNVSGNWFTFVCGTSGTHTPANTDVSGGPITFFLTPPTPLAVGETCVLSFDTAQITDQGPSEFPLENPGTISFVVAEPPPNLPPSVSSTVPSQGASNFPSAGDLKVTFNEPVVLGSGAFTLTCAQSSGIALTPSTTDGGVNFTIDTGTALIAGDSCQFGIHQAGIQDLAGAPLDQNYTISFAVMDAANTGTYYQNVNLASPEMLRCTLHDTIKGHTRYPYEWPNLEVADEAPAGVCAPGSASSENYILDIYRNRCYQKITDRSNPVGPNNYNREHVWPKSIGFNNSGLAAHNDLHMLHLSASDHNGTRDNNPYDNCTGGGCTAYGTDPNNGMGGPGPRGNSNWSNGSVFEVWDAKKGDMARTIFYMAIRYEGISSEDAHDGNIPDLELTDNLSLVQITSNTASHAYMGKLSTLLQWHAQDVPDERELQRTGVVQGFQGNRNPFIDHPEWGVLALFQSSQPATCTQNLNAPVASADSYVVAQDVALVVTTANGVLLNDSDVEFAAAGSVPADWFKLTAEQLSIPLSGSVSLSANGSFTYTAAAGFCGTDSFTYRTSDGTRWSTPTTVTIAVGTDCEAGSPAIFSDGFEQD